MFLTDITYMPKMTTDMGYELHMMVADENETYDIYQYDGSSFEVESGSNLKFVNYRNPK